MQRLITVTLLGLAIVIPAIDTLRLPHVQPPVPGLPANTEPTTPGPPTKSTAALFTGPHLLDNYIPPVMQALAYYIELLQYEPTQMTTIEPPFAGIEAEGGTTYTQPPNTTPLATSTLSTTNNPWWQPSTRPTTTRPTTSWTTTPQTPSTPWWPTTAQGTDKPTTVWWQPSTTTKKPETTTSTWQTTSTTIRPEYPTSTVPWWHTTTTKKPIIVTTQSPWWTTTSSSVQQTTPMHAPGIFAPNPPVFYSKPNKPNDHNSIQTTTKSPIQTTKSPCQHTISYNRPIPTTTRKPTTSWWTTTLRPKTTSRTTTRPTTRRTTTTNRPTTAWYRPPSTTYKPFSTTYRPPTTTTRRPTTTYWPSTTTYRPPTTTYRPSTTTYRPQAPTTTPRPNSIENSFPSIASDTHFYEWFFQPKAKQIQPTFEYDFQLLDPLPAALIRDINNERYELPALLDKDNINEFRRTYDDYFGRYLPISGKKRVPPTKPYVEFLMLYDLLKREAKSLNLNKYEGYTEAILKDLAELSQRSAERQLHTLLTRMVIRQEVTSTNILNRVNSIIKDLENPDSVASKALRYIPTLKFVP